MKNYLRHLHADLAAAHRPEGDDTSHPTTLEEELEDIEHWMGTDPLTTFGQYCGLERQSFPPAERLTAAQLSKLNEAFEQMMFSWGVDAELPDELPPALRYDWLLKTLDEGIHLMGEGGFVIINFCGEVPEECAFGQEYCTCGRQVDAWEHNRRTSETHETMEALILELRSRIGEMVQTLEFHSALSDMESGQSGELAFKPLAEWLEIDLGEFPPPAALTYLEQSALADELLSLFDRDDDMVIAINGMSDPARRYLAALGYYSQPVHHDGGGAWRIKPLSAEETEAMWKQAKSPFDSLPGWEAPHPTIWDEDVDPLPF